MLARYTSKAGQPREIIARPGPAGSLLVVDQNVVDPRDSRLVAHLGDDEPAGNARLECAAYIDAIARGHGGCRQLEDRDLIHLPSYLEDRDVYASRRSVDAQPVDSQGFRYQLSLVPSDMSIPQLRWCMRESMVAEPRPTSVREVVARLESYEPVRTVTRAALARHSEDDGVSITVLRAELQRLLESPIVLNRALRHAVLVITERRGLSMSEIATRCGRVKVDGRGNRSGETSWLARRIGVLPEAGQSVPTPWVHSDVLALIAREGLGISPREVEADGDELASTIVSARLEREHSIA